MSAEIETASRNWATTFPQAAAPAANYVPFVISGNVLHISGQLPMLDGKLAVTGHLGRNVDVAGGQRAAELCALRPSRPGQGRPRGPLAHQRIIKINGFVASAPDFVEQHLVINGASNFLVAALGDAGKHARAAVGMAALPLNAAVEIDAIMEIA